MLRLKLRRDSPLTGALALTLASGVLQVDFESSDCSRRDLSCGQFENGVVCENPIRGPKRSLFFAVIRIWISITITARSSYALHA